MGPVAWPVCKSCGTSRFSAFTNTPFLGICCYPGWVLYPSEGLDKSLKTKPVRKNVVNRQTPLPDHCFRSALCDKRFLDDRHSLCAPHYLSTGCVRLLNTWTIAAGTKKLSLILICYGLNQEFPQEGHVLRDGCYSCFAVRSRT